MKNHMLSEVNNYVHKILVFTKVEKYVRIGNQWLLEASGKALEQAHEAVQRVKRGELEQYLQLSRTKVAEYLSTGKTWLLDTPERALIRAYHAALLLKKLEEKHLAGDEVVSVASYGDNVSAYFQLVSSKYLILIQVRLLEFKASSWVIETPHLNQLTPGAADETSAILEKLRFIDEVLARYYQDQQSEPSISAEQAGVATYQFVTEQFATHQFVTEQFVTEQFITEQFVTEQSVSVTEQSVSVTEQPATQQFAMEQSITEQSATGRSIGCVEQPIHNLLDDSWKLLGSLHLSSQQADDPSTSPIAAPMTPPKTEQLPQILPLLDHLTKNRFAKVKLASTVFAGGFVAGFVTGGVYSWALAATQPITHTATSSYKHQPSTKAYSNCTPVPAEAMSHPIAPEVMSPEPSPSVDTSIRDLRLYQSITTVHSGRALTQSARAKRIDRPSVPQYLPLEFSTSTQKSTFGQPVPALF